MIKIKKKMVLILGIVIVILTILAIFLIQKSNNNTYPKEPIKFSSLSTTQEDINIESIKMPQKEDISIYTVQPSDKDTLINTMVKNMGIIFEDKNIKGIDPKIWNNGKDILRYYVVTETLEFQLKNSVKLEETDNVLKEFFYEYLGISYDFKITDERITVEGTKRIYGSRLVGGTPLEIGYGYEYSDYLEFDKKGNIIGGAILLTDFKKEDISVPTVSDQYIREMINKDAYPKEVYLNTSILTQSIKLNYLDDAWGEIEKSASNCKGKDIEVVFLFKEKNQKYLLPVYKISGDCEVKYKNVGYNVPSVFYALAADPKYIVKE